MSTQNVNVARFARNVEWDFFCNFQTLWQTTKITKIAIRPNWKTKPNFGRSLENSKTYNCFEERKHNQIKRCSTQKLSDKTTLQQRWRWLTSTITIKNSISSLQFLTIFSCVFDQLQRILLNVSPLSCCQEFHRNLQD